MNDSLYVGGPLQEQICNEKDAKQTICGKAHFDF